VLLMARDRELIVGMPSRRPTEIKVDGIYMIKESLKHRLYRVIAIDDGDQVVVQDDAGNQIKLPGAWCRRCLERMPFAGLGTCQIRHETDAERAAKQPTGAIFGWAAAALLAAIIAIAAIVFAPKTEIDTTRTEAQTWSAE
jgi:hypothetical protein